MSDDFLYDTRKALGDKILKKIQNSSFCIAGCGGVGSLFAEMLVRTGADDINLIDGDHIERDNLNRTMSFLECDVGKDKLKVDVLKTRLESIVPPDSRLVVRAYPNHLMDEDEREHRPIILSDYVIIAMNTNHARLRCERICQQKRSNNSISIGVEIKPDGEAYYECIWNCKTKKEAINREGYGHGSYASIVMEATAVGFNMLLSDLKNPASDYDYITRKYKNFIPDP